jgi:8-oxo-dGTP pyrophosphatase MutT (NUDIX family)
MSLNRISQKTWFGFGGALSRMKVPRSAVVPYILIEDQLFFLFAKDTKSGDYTDMGGGVKGDEFPLSGAIREFKEESNAIFPPEMYNTNLFGSLPMAICDKTSSIFYPVEKTWLEEAPFLFIEQRKSLKGTNQKLCKGYDEVSGLRWFSESELLGLCTTETVDGVKIWKKLRNVYRTILTPTFLQLLKLSYTHS